MSDHCGDYALESTVTVNFNTAVNGAPTVLGGSPTVVAYIGNSTTEITAGITLTVSLDSRVGFNNIQVAATAANGYTAGTNVELMLSAGSVGSTSVIGMSCGSFTLQKESALRPTVDARTLDVTTTGGAGIDWANVEAPTTTLALTGTTIATTQKVDIETIKTNPVVNGGTITFPTTATLASTTNITAGTITTVTTTTTATNLTNAPTAGDFTAVMKTSLGTAVAASAVASVTGNVGGNVNGNVVGSVGSVTGNVGGNVVGTVASVVGNVGGNVTGSVGSVVGAVSSVTGNVGGNVVGTVASVVGNVGGNVAGAVASVVGNLGGNVVGSVGSVAGNVSGNVTGTIGGLTVGALADFFDTNSGKVYADAVAGSVVFEIVDNAGGTPPTVQQIVDGVWDEPFASHVDAGSFGLIVGGIGVDGAGLSLIPWNPAWDAEVQSEVLDAIRTQLTGTVSAVGSVPTLDQMAYLVNQFVLNAAVVGTTKSIYAADGSTVLFTLTLNSATNPTSSTRAT